MFLYTIERTYFPFVPAVYTFPVVFAFFTYPVDADDKHSLTLKWPGGKVGQEMTRVKSTGSMVSRQKSMTQGAYSKT